ncbi:N-acetylmuramoyl-L-alanine amidase [Sphingomonas jatrophae]|uniref:N-acetylmuramoyl-L-alanine amidase n=1 Tax=Sphingomonas jatrophae TaxID=1166337 RepID=A0A1I6JLN2_9SPHN|nr:N-acetylmuramoyl-L-alanine amidase [Sphingomonas jatrophae]SFR79811.1 N-acetylmuramoyl-L-alanine amidase [Sphingomonas jatrophae]
MAIAWMNAQALRYLTLHCAATPEGRDDKAGAVTAWDKAKFGQPSYHWVIELDGTAVRTLRDDQRGAHTGGANTGNIGICYVGGVDKAGRPKDTRTPAQLATMERLVREYRARFPRLIVRGHRDWSPDRDRDGKIEPHEWLKACPCFDVAAWLRGIGL